MKNRINIYLFFIVLQENEGDLYLSSVIIHEDKITNLVYKLITASFYVKNYVFFSLPFPGIATRFLVGYVRYLT